ncbi:MAG: adenylate/guanylate cyclase domain-containing protein [Solirubrobacterales bacterium]|nr:adenylate/guanylate cyclase domain-containing protein [Solirubrobacterales bacterium]
MPAAELRRAVAEDRLALLPVERALSGEGERHTVAEVAARSGLERPFLDRLWRSLGMAVPGDDERALSDEDVAAARRVAALREAGVPEEGILEVSRLLGMTMSQLAAANRRLIADAFLREGDNEYDVAVRFADAARSFTPLIGEALTHTLNLHLREQIRHDAFGAAELSAGRPAAAEEVTVAFADVVGFTRLGETLDPDQLGAVTGRLGELAAEVVAPPVRLVKLIGDAAMLVGPEPKPVLDAALGLVGATQVEDFPILRAGVASGEALPRAGDWYGRPVNLASRITAIARPGSVLATEPVRDRLEDEYRWSFAGSRRLKGIEGQVKLHRCRPADSGDENG